MKSFKFLPVLVISAVMFTAMQSCNNDDKKSETTDSSTVKSADSPVVMAPVKPANILVVMHKVKDFDKWLPVFEADDSAQTAAGLSRRVVARGIDDPSMVLIGFRMSDYDKAKAMGSSDALKAKMEEAGVTSQPAMHFLDTQVMDTTTDGLSDRMIIFSKVKDYDAWKKSYDTHSDVRKNGGVTDRAVAYEMGDNKSVAVVLGINDLKKARDFAKSPELKARMDSAGVISKPEMFFYHVVKMYK